jgi:outer membrane protein OmpA-like peptidoglycan-associated protein
VILTLGDVLFDTDEASLKPAAIRTMGRLAEFLSENPETRIIVEGHADSRGSFAYNEQLSQRRAQAVADAMVVRGIDRDRFRAVGRGEAFPVATNATSAGRQENRRVEVVFSDNSGRFAEAAETALR